MNICWELCWCTVYATRARALAEDAFFHPSIMSISYASIEHYFAIYMVSILLQTCVSFPNFYDGAHNFL
jgi:hypothetical protein